MLLHRAEGFVPSRVERLQVVTLQFDFQNLIEVQDGFVCFADLEILIDRPCDLPARERAFFFLCSFTLVIFLRPLADLRIMNLEVCLGISLIHTVASIGRLAHDTELLKFMRWIRKFLKSCQPLLSSWEWFWLRQVGHMDDKTVFL